jgi:Asp-tRNA(Asn)/Glu-tRNA(Gln) amidotransferase C subunit
MVKKNCLKKEVVTKLQRLKMLKSSEEEEEEEGDL